MINITGVLTRYGISHTSQIAAMQDVRAYIDGRISAASALIEVLIGVQVEFQDLEIAVVTAQAVVEKLLKDACQYEDASSVLTSAQERCQKMVDDPNLKWTFAKAPTGTTTQGGQMMKVSATVDIQVEVKADGQIKKGGKQVVANALYDLHVLKSATPMDNKTFIELLMADLQMTKSGATTYAYNARKAAGQVVART